MTLLIEHLETIIRLFESFGQVQKYPENDERLFHTIFRGSIVVGMREGPFMTISCRDENTMKYIKDLLQMVLAPEPPETKEGEDTNES